MRIVEGEQYTPEWREARRGLPSASNAHKILSPTGKLSTQAEGYIHELIAERFRVGDIDNLSEFATVAMRNGSACEPEARRWYCFEQNCKVRQVCLCVSDDGKSCCSPDGLRDDRGLELKCPTGKTQIGYIIEPQSLVEAYKPQIHFSMVVTGFNRWDILSYVAGLDPVLVTVEQDKYTDAMQDALEAFEARYAELLARFTETTPALSPAESLAMGARS